MTLEIDIDDMRSENLLIKLVLLTWQVKDTFEEVIIWLIKNVYNFKKYLNEWKKIWFTKFEFFFL